MFTKIYMSFLVAIGGFLVIGTTRTPDVVHTAKASCARTTAMASAHGGNQRYSLTSLMSSARTRPLMLHDTSSKKCGTCHEDETASFHNSTHAKTTNASAPTCENCHGDATKHIAEGGSKATIVTFSKLSPTESAKICQTCHEKSGNQSHFSQSEHLAAGVACTTCHDVHPGGKDKAVRTSAGLSAMMRGPQKELCLSCHKDVGAQFSLPTHHRMQEGVVECTSCHNPH